MLVVMQAHATEEQVRAVCQRIESLGYRAHSMPGATRTAIGITGNQGEVEQGTLRRDARRPGSHPRQQALQAREPRRQRREHRHPLPGHASYHRRRRTLRSSPVPAPSRAASRRSLSPKRVARAGAQFFRGGAYKPRTSPYAFQGLGEEGLKIMAEIREQLRDADRHRSHRQRVARTGRGVCGRHPDRRPQHAELLAC